uniref:Dual specificity protein phosphatase n=2 Tax=Arion vulgaris TaxID=1028688 RepID=A0A0B7BA16_9EUPU
MNTLFDDDRPCTIQELDNIITAPTGGLTLYPSRAYDEVYDGIFVGEGDSARSVNCMIRLAVTHVLNAALGEDRFHVNTNSDTYKRANIQFLGIEATDFINCDLSKHFVLAADFIQSGLQGGGTAWTPALESYWKPGNAGPMQRPVGIRILE